tara:strand:- start:227 stop:655 length:429 start_codon:yes stop_codon:yes gene_type:complete
MSRLLENVLRQRKESTLLSEIDMTKSGSAMLRYLGQGYPYDEEYDVPIEPEPSSWSQEIINNKNVLVKVYELENNKSLLYFINELISLSENMHHHPEIIIDHMKVTITLYTRDLNDITERDIEMSKSIDEIIEDINIIKFRR